jgi:uncharacterized membrane protein
MSTISAPSSLAGLDFRHLLAANLLAAKRRRATALANRRGTTISRIARHQRLCPQLGLGLGIVAIAILAATPAAADFRICNVTKSRVGIAIGYKDGEGWATEGWWNVAAGSCETLLRGKLAARFYYIYGVDYDRGGEWSGQAFMCTRDKEFTIRGTGDCLARGYDRTGFFEVDTGEQQTWTVQLTETGETAQQPGAAGRPLGPLPGVRSLQSLPSTGNTAR